MKLTPQHNQILKMLEDGLYHCPTVELYMKDDRKRISELIKGGYNILGDKLCDNPNHGHISRIKLRRLAPSFIQVIKQPSDTCVKDYRCYWNRKFGNCHCVKAKETLKTLF